MNGKLVKTIKRSVPDPVVQRGRKLIDSISRSPVGAPGGIRTEISRQLNRKSELPHSACADIFATTDDASQLQPFLGLLR